MVTSRRPTAAPSFRKGMWLSLLLATLAFGSAACGGDEVADSSEWNTDEPDTGESDAEVIPDVERPVADELAARAAQIKTIIDHPMPLTAGERFDVTCQFIDEDGEVMTFPEDEEPPSRVNVSPSNLLQLRAGQLEAQRVGEATVACTSPL